MGYWIVYVINGNQHIHTNYNSPNYFGAKHKMDKQDHSVEWYLSMIHDNNSHMTWIFEYHVAVWLCTCQEISVTRRYYVVLYKDVWLMWRVQGIFLYLF